jgi:hypothetical protein
LTGEFQEHFRIILETIDLLHLPGKIRPTTVEIGMDLFCQGTIQIFGIHEISLQLGVKDRYNISKNENLVNQKISKTKQFLSKTNTI